MAAQYAVKLEEKKTKKQKGGHLGRAKMAETASGDAQTGEERVEEYQRYNGARVLWPADMPDEMLALTVSAAQTAMKEFVNVEREGAKIAERVKKQLDKEYGPHWHVVFGSAFGSHAVHEKNRFVYFYLDPFAFMVYKAGSG